MNVSVAELVSWVVVGLLAGNIVGWLLTGKREGFGWFKNLTFGLVGGIVGGFLFIKLLDFDPFNMSQYKVTLQDIVAAILGALIVLLVYKLIGGKKPAAPAAK